MKKSGKPITAGQHLCEGDGTWRYYVSKAKFCCSTKSCTWNEI